MTRTAGTAPRWAVSFADLGLLLLGCFIYLNAVERGRGGEAQAAPVTHVLARLDADTLFPAGEARLTAAGEARLAPLARAGRYSLVSTGLPSATARLDPFELASARAAAVARALRGGGAVVEIEMRAGEGTQGFSLSVQD